MNEEVKKTHIERERHSMRGAVHQATSSSDLVRTVRNRSTVL